MVLCTKKGPTVGTNFEGKTHICNLILLNNSKQPVNILLIICYIEGASYL